jgi:hypothetical protein
MSLLSYVRNVAIAVDQFANAVLFGWPDETLSSRCGRSIHRYPYKAWAKLIDAIFHPFQGPNHCVNAYRKELTRYQFPPEMRGAPPTDEKKTETIVS